MISAGGREAHRLVPIKEADWRLLRCLLEAGGDAYINAVGTLGVGICEANRIQLGWANPYENPANVQALKAGYTPGDLNFDPLGLKPTDPAELREMQAKELSHGRLGMLAAAGFLAQEAATGSTWGQGDFSFENLVLGPFFKQEAVELARDAMTFTN